jgi:hypothetical protein
MTWPATTAFALALAATAAACTLYPAEPTAPTYARDIHPIFMAHCARCHGGGGVLSNETINGKAQTGKPVACYLDAFEDRGDCSAVDGGAPDPTLCRRGAKFCTAPVTGSRSFLDIYLFEMAGTAKRMPPPPAPELNEWEMTTIRRWLDNGAPP